MAAVAVLGAAAPGWAHAIQISVSPPDGSSVPQVPDAVVVTFNETPQELGTQASAEGPDGAIETPLVISGNSVEIGLPEEATAGRYTVRWRVTSTDGHPIQGSTTFTADRGAAGGAEPQEGPVTVSEPPATNGLDSTNPDESLAPTAQDGETDGLSGTALVIGLIVALAAGAGVVLALAKRRKG